MHDRRLLLQMRRGSDAAARRLLGLHGSAMAAAARAALPPADDRAHDAVQHVLLTLLTRSASELRGVRDTRAYLCTAARHAALNLARSTTRQRARDRAHDLAPVCAPAANHDPDLARALDDLPPDHREVLLLKHHARLTFDQIALATGTPRGTVVSRHAAALDLLRQHLDPAPRPLPEPAR